MVFADEFLYIHGSPTHLLSVHVADQGLLVNDIFFAHAASLRQTFYFARWEFSGVSSQLLTYVSGPDNISLVPAGGIEPTGHVEIT
jgi:hypothetical protein